MAKTKQTQKTKGKEVNTMEQAEPKYYTAYPSYTAETDKTPKRVKGLVMNIEGHTYYINLIEPVITEKKQGNRVIYSRKEYSVIEIPQETKDKDDADKAL